MEMMTINDYCKDCDPNKEMEAEIKRVCLLAGYECGEENGVTTYPKDFLEIYFAKPYEV
jgi:hypothetical protein